ncbi:MAG: S8 family peptidase [Luteibaculum sp.]
MEKLKRFRNIKWENWLSSGLVMLVLLLAGSAVAQEDKLYNLNLVSDSSFLSKSQGEGIVIAVFDAGFVGAQEYPWFQKIEQEGRLLGSFNLVDSGSVYTGSSHGTMVLSILAGDEKTFTGSAPKANYLLFKTENADIEVIEEEYNWGKAVDIADSLGVDIINSSLSYTEFDHPQENHAKINLDGKTAPITQFALKAARIGILVVNSAGNKGNKEWFKIGFPADADSILSVGAVAANGEISPFSSRGNTVDGRIKPEVVAMGEDVQYYDSRGLTFGDGTSFSAPIISGLCARLMAAIPGFKAQDYLQAVLRSASQFQNPDSVLGFGIPSFSGAYEWLNTQRILAEGGAEKVLRFGPNPVQLGSSLNVFHGGEEIEEFVIVDLMGRRVLTTAISSGPSETAIPVQVDAGMYTLLAISNKGELINVGLVEVVR